ncbi:MAG: MFS transporter [Clostridia bacterium]|nr:MFS transporter [Clostridia bacterium]
MKRLPLSKQVAFSIGQLGWSLLSGIVVSYLVYFYQPTKEASLPHYLPQTLVFGLFTIVGFITAFERLFDAFVDPLVASFSDRSEHPQGRRIPFLKYSALPFALSTALVFYMPVNGVSWINAAWLFTTLTISYIGLSSYVTPFNALIPELGKTQKDRLNISTFISLTFILGTAIAYTAPMIWEALTANGWDKVIAMQTTFTGLSVLAFICLLVPAFSIREKEYVDVTPDQSNAFTSLKKTFNNPHFRLFVASDVSYWIALALFQTGLPYYIKVLLKLPESMITLLFVSMTAASLLFYLPVNLLSKRIGKKKLINFAFVMFSITFLLTFFVGEGFPLLSMRAQGYMLVISAAIPLAIFGILPQAVVADISQYDVLHTGENREGMFFAARTFAYKIGQMASMLLFTTFLTYGSDFQKDTGIRITALAASVFCFVGLMVFLFYKETIVNNEIHTREGAPYETL